eukprot:gene6453-biopygen14935
MAQTPAPPLQLGAFVLTSCSVAQEQVSSGMYYARHGDRTWNEVLTTAGLNILPKQMGTATVEPKHATGTTHHKQRPGLGRPPSEA